MNCYIVTLDGHVLGVFSSIEKANAWIDGESSMTRGEKYECRCNIERWEIDSDE